MTATWLGSRLVRGPERQHSEMFRAQSQDRTNTQGLRMRNKCYNKRRCYLCPGSKMAEDFPVEI